MFTVNAMRKILFLAIILAAAAGGAFYYWNEQAVKAGKVYKYRDDAGQLHYVDSMERIPEKFKSRAEQHELPIIGKGDYQPYLDSLNAGSDKNKRR
jgi:hypothetical protein